MSRPVARFEELIAWQRARDLTREIYQITRNGAFAKDFGLSGQVQRAAVSIMSNIAEGFERGSRSQFRQFLAIAKASCGEVRSQLYVALDVGYLDQEGFDKFLIQTEELARIIGGLRVAIEKPRNQPQERI